MICPNCGMNNRGDAKFCKSCGTPTNVSTPSAGEQAGVITIADNMPQGLSVFEQMVGLEVVFISGLRGGERSVITKFPATIGRDPNSTLPLALHDQLASTRHAQIRYENRRFILKDVGSSNGTYREGQRITESTLGNGDVFEFGIGGPKIKFNILANGQSIANAPSEAQTLQPMSPADLMPPPAPPPPPPPAPVLPPPVSLGEVSRADSLPEWARNAPIPPNANVARPQSFISEEIPPPAPPPPPPPAPVVEPPPPVYSAPPAPATYAPPPPPPPMMSTPPAGNPPVMVSSQVEGQLPSTDAAPPKKKGSTLIIIIVLVLVIFLLLLAVAAVVAWKFLK